MSVTLGLLAPLMASAFLAGCGLGAGRAPGAVQLTVSDDFGGVLVRSWRAPQVRGEETVMSLLMRNARVSTRYSGGFVESIDGLSGGHEGSRPVDWFYYVNGREAPQGAASTEVHAGDHIWWDRHDWSQTDHIPAVVGSFPQPFLNGIDGKRLPVRVECAQVQGRACSAVLAQLRSAGVPAAVAGLGSGNGGESATLRVQVAPWARLRGDTVTGAIARGPAASGVYVRFSASGRTLSLLDRDGGLVRELGAGSGLIAATALEAGAPVWVVTGTDVAGMERAADAFAQADLANHFAIAVSAAAGRLAITAVPR